MNWLKSVFTDSVDFGRVNPAGLIVMCIGIAAVLFAGRIAAGVRFLSGSGAKNTIKIIGLIISAGGALLAILG